MTPIGQARTIVLASPDPLSGKSAVAIGLLDEMRQQFRRVSVFRPIVRSDGVHDHVLTMLLEQLGASQRYADAIGVTYDQMIADPVAAMTIIVEKANRLSEDCDALLVVGSDYTDVAGPMEFGFNAEVAANLGAPIILVVSARHRSPELVARAAESAMADARLHHASVLAVIANRACADQLADVRSALSRVGCPAYAIPEIPLLGARSVGQLAGAVSGRQVYGPPAALDREALEITIAAGRLDHDLLTLSDDALVVVSGDRPDTLLGVVLSQALSGPRIAGIVVTGSYTIPEPLLRLITAILDAAGAEIAVISAPDDISTAAQQLLAAPGNATSFSQRKVEAALEAFRTHVAGAELVRGTAASVPDIVTPRMFEQMLLSRARAARRHIVLPEGTEERILQAAAFLLERDICRITLLGPPDVIKAKAAEVGVDISGAQIIDPPSSDLLPRFAKEYAELRKHKKIPYDQALDHCTDVSYFGTMMVLDGLADGMVSGAAHTTAHTIRPALEVIKTTPDVSVVSSVFFMCLPDRVLVYGDCAVNPDPDPAQLADIAISSARTARQFGIEPRVAMLSYSTGESGSGADVEKVRQATELVRQRMPQLPVEGPIQYDAAVDPVVAQAKLAESPVAGQATVLIFPDLNTGNNTYKAVQRSAGALAIGPVLQGLRKPVNDLSRGALVSDIINTVAITAIQAAGERAEPTA